LQVDQKRGKKKKRVTRLGQKEPSLSLTLYTLLEKGVKGRA
jgi:hypothetical protein